MPLTTARGRRVAAIAAAAAIASVAAGCGLADPMQQNTTQTAITQAQTPTRKPATPVITAAAADAVRRFSNAYVDLLNGQGARAEAALRAAASTRLADGASR